MATRKTTSTTSTRKKTTTATKSTSKTAAKSTAKPTTKATPTKSAPKTAVVKPATPVVVASSTPTAIGPELKKRELIDKVVKLSGVKKRDVKPTVEAMLKVLGEAITEGRELSLEPLGKAKVNRAKQKSGHRISMLKLRQKTDSAKPAKDDQDPLAPAAE